MLKSQKTQIKKYKELEVGDIVGFPKYCLRKGKKGYYGFNDYGILTFKEVIGKNSEEMKHHIVFKDCKTGQYEDFVSGLNTSFLCLIGGLESGNKKG